MTEPLTGDAAPCSNLCYCTRAQHLATIKRLDSALMLAQAWMLPVQPEMPGQEALRAAHATVRQALGLAVDEQPAIGPAPEGECPDCGTPYAMGVHTDECPRS